MKHHSLALSLALGTAALLGSCAYHEIAWQEHPVRRMPVSYAKPQLWNKRHLTWRLEAMNVPTRLSPTELQQSISTCFRSWEAAGVFTFSQAPIGAPADIVISFCPPPGRSWDGQLGHMGHATFPWSRERGRIYLDPAEWWSTNAISLVGDPLQSWLPHEIGHVLGLQHTPKQDQTMSESGPYEQPGVESYAQLRRLYAPHTPVFTWVQCVTDHSAE